MTKLAQIGDTTPCCGHTEWSTDLLELGPDPKWWRHHPLSNTSKNTLFQCHMIKLWPKQWRRVCWIRGWHGSWVGDELQLGEDHNVSVSSVVMSSSSSPSWIGVILDSILVMSSSNPIDLSSSSSTWIWLGHVFSQSHPRSCGMAQSSCLVPWVLQCNRIARWQIGKCTTCSHVTSSSI
jgi:hypothetical protein